MAASEQHKSPHEEEERKFVESEFYRLGFDRDSKWRISDINKDFKLCETYPRFLIVPAEFTDDDLESVAKFRYFRRIPTAVWRHMRNGCFIVRSSQPTVGWFGWFRSELDESLVQTYVNNTIHQRQQRERLPGASELEDGCAGEPRANKANKNSSSNNNNNNNDININHRDPPAVVNGQDDEDDCEGATNISKNNKCRLSTSATAPTTNGANGDHNQRQHSDNSDSDCTHLNGSIAAVENGRPHSDTPGDESPTNCYNNDQDPSDDTPLPAGTRSEDHATPLPTATGTSTTPTTPATRNTSEMLIIDARSYAAAMANRAKGGGCECSEYYQQCEVHFMNLANIHSIRKSYHAIRSACEAYSEQSNNWVSFLDNSRWLHHISGLLRSALLVVDALDIEEKSVLIHCSDGWDRTPQLVALAEIMLDPHYRTFDGFRTLTQREWLDFGHKFADRCGSNPCNEDPCERCPTFLQWLDCVQQLLVQFPKHFEFNAQYLDKLNRHTHSNVFGTFSYNSNQERALSRIDERMGSLWSYIDSARHAYTNEDYVKSEDILRPSYKVKDLHFWKEVYLPPVN